jgi:hypothetical protein
MENMMNSGHGGWEGETIGDWGDNVGDGEGTKETRSELGAWVVSKGDVLGGEFHTVADSEGKRAAVTVGLFGLAGLGEVKFTGDGSLDVTDGVEVVSSGGVIGVYEGGRGGRVETVVREAVHGDV